MLDLKNNDDIIDDFFQENQLTDMLGKAADIDEETKRKWGNAQTVEDNLKVINSVSSRAADNLGTIAGHVGRNIVDGRSIIARARNSVQEFPVYISRSIPVNPGHLIAKAFERVYASYFQTALAQNPIIDEKDANNLVFLKQFHSNIREGAEKMLNPFYEPIDDWDSMMQESIYTSRKLNDNCVLEFRVVPTENADLIAESARLTHEPLEGFYYLREASDDNAKQTRRNSTKVLTDDEINDLLITSNRTSVTRDDIKLADMSTADIAKDVNDELGQAPKHPGSSASQDEKDKYDKEMQDYKNKRDRLIRMKHAAALSASKKIKRAQETIREDIENNKIAGYSIDSAGRICRTDVSTTTDPTPVDMPMLLKDSDVKKINGMLPYTIEATFRMRSKEGITRDVKYLIGIKTVLHPIRVQDLAEDLRDLVMGNVKSLRKVRYKTGELSFKDYMFNIKGLKADASKHINYDKRWINTLKRLGEYQSLNGSLFKKPVEAMANGGVPIPNGTLVLAQPDVTALTNQTGVDLSEVGNAKRLAKTLFLIAVVIVDSSAGSMRVLFPDSSDDWDVQSLASIDAEMAKTDNSQLMRELSKVVNR